jgi:hypothetical protein
MTQDNNTGTGPGDVTVRERADAIWLRLLDAWLAGVGEFCIEISELVERELRTLVLDVSHRLLEAAGVVPGGGRAGGGDRPVGGGLASWMPWLPGLLEAGQKGEAQLLLALDGLTIESCGGSRSPSGSIISASTCRRDAAAGETTSGGER